MQDTHPKRRDQAEQHWKCNGNRDTALLFRHTQQVSPQCEWQNSNNFVFFLTTLRRRRVLHLSPTCHANPLVSLIHNTLYMCLRLYVPAACGYCYATLVSPKRAPLYCCRYTLSIRPQQLSTIQPSGTPSVLLSPGKSRSSVLLTIQI